MKPLRWTPRIEGGSSRSQASDRALWDAVRGGDEAAFGEIFDRHAARIASYCFHRTADPETAKDLTSIVFLEAWRRRRDARFADDRVLAWLYGIATNVVRNQWRSQRRYRAALARLPRLEVQPDFVEEAQSRLAAAQEMTEIKRYIDELPEGERDCLALCTWHGLSSSEAAVALGIPAATVRTRLHRAHERIRQRLSADTGDDAVMAPERRAQ
jgi:RNA polymerase sigma factor (sigma-70 family)